MLHRCVLDASTEGRLPAVRWAASHLSSWGHQGTYDGIERPADNPLAPHQQLRAANTSSLFMLSEPWADSITAVPSGMPGAFSMLPCTLTLTAV